MHAATNSTPCLPHSTLQHLFVAMHITVAMSCHLEAAVRSCPPHAPRPMSCPSLSLSPGARGCPCAPGCLLLTASPMGCPCSPQGVASPHCALAVLNHGSLVFCYSQPCVSLYTGTHHVLLTAPFPIAAGGGACTSATCQFYSSLSFSFYSFNSCPFFAFLPSLWPSLSMAF